MALRPAPHDSPELAAAVAQARAAWPELSVDEDRLRRWLAERADADTPVSRLQAGDLLLACACADGDPAALAAFHAAHDGAIAATLASARGRGSDPDELRQALDVHLFVADRDRPARIVEYRGAGSLRTWVRVVAARLLLNTGRRQGDRSDPLPATVERALTDGADLELDWLKAKYHAAFRSAVAEALAELSPADKSLLRLCVVNGLSATGVAALYRVHRATAKRWLARVRTEVHERTREHLRRQLAVEPDELDSILGLIGSRLDASVRRMLDSGGASDVA